MVAYLKPGSVVTKSGIYRVSHSNGHLADAESILVKGLKLPSCFFDGCRVSYSLVSTADLLSEDEDFKDS